MGDGSAPLNPVARPRRVPARVDMHTRGAGSAAAMTTHADCEHELSIAMTARAWACRWLAVTPLLVALVYAFAWLMASLHVLSFWGAAWLGAVTCSVQAAGRPWLVFDSRAVWDETRYWRLRRRRYWLHGRARDSRAGGRLLFEYADVSRWGVARRGGWSVLEVTLLSGRRISFPFDCPDAGAESVIAAIGAWMARAGPDASRRSAF